MYRINLEDVGHPGGRVMTRAFRVKYVGDCMVPAYGTLGTAYRCDGYHDLYSTEYGAYLFFPDGIDEESEETGFYVSDDDLEDV